ncbi:MAG: hypothetical protein IKI30_01095 [Oxalobacter sp.]|nr:hypothetical protein [Oxalobacter sp.]
MTVFKHYLITVIFGIISLVAMVGGGLWITVESSKKYLATHPGHPSPIAFIVFAFMIWIVLFVVYLIIDFFCARKLPSHRIRHFFLGILAYIATVVLLPVVTAFLT